MLQGLSGFYSTEHNDLQLEERGGTSSFFVLNSIPLFGYTGSYLSHQRVDALILSAFGHCE